MGQVFIAPDCKARAELGYAPATSREQGLAELNASRPAASSI